ncbi:hypothetical protein IC582_027020 [Cucumis melo]
MADHQRDGGENYFAFHQNKEVTEGRSGNRYGGLAPKKKPLISKDHERAFFDSADWALCKQGAGLYNNVAVEKLQPKLQDPKATASTKEANLYIREGQYRRTNRELKGHCEEI